MRSWTRDFWLLALQSRRLELIAVLPFDQARLAGRPGPSQCESEARHRRVADEIHLRMVFVARLVVVLLDVVMLLLDAPRVRMSLKLYCPRQWRTTECQLSPD